MNVIISAALANLRLEDEICVNYMYNSLTKQFLDSVQECKSIQVEMHYIQTSTFSLMGQKIFYPFWICGG